MKKKKRQKLKRLPDFWLDDSDVASTAPPTAPQPSDEAEDSTTHIYTGGILRDRLSSMRPRTVEKPKKPALRRPSKYAFSLAPETAEQPKAKKQQNSRQDGKPAHEKPYKMSSLSRQQLRNRLGSKQEQPQSPGVSISIHMPEIHLPKVPWAKLKAKRPGRKYLILFATVAVVLAVAGVSSFIFKDKIGGGKGGSANESKEISFKALRPVSGNAQLKIDSQKQVISFQDSFGQTRLVVTQQNLPEKIKTDPGAFKAMLSTFGIKEQDSFDTVLGKMYTTEKVNPAGSRLQFAVVKMEDRLLFINATTKMTPESWRDYLATLETSRN